MAKYTPQQTHKLKLALRDFVGTHSVKGSYSNSHTQKLPIEELCNVAKFGITQGGEALQHAAILVLSATRDGCSEPLRVEGVEASQAWRNLSGSCRDLYCIDPAPTYAAFLKTYPNYQPVI